MPRIFELPKRPDIQIFICDCWLEKLTGVPSARNQAELGISIVADRPGVITCMKCGAIWDRQDEVTFVALNSLLVTMSDFERKELLLSA